MKRCPVDDFTLAPRAYDGVEIDCCPTCGGVWLDAGELDAIQERKGLDGQPAPRADAPSLPSYTASSAEQSYACPVCSERLEKRDYGFGSGVTVDSCPKGHGVWLDAGELQTLEALYEQGNAEADAEFDALMADVQGEGGMLSRLKRVFLG